VGVADQPADYYYRDTNCKITISDQKTLRGTNLGTTGREKALAKQRMTLAEEMHPGHDFSGASNRIADPTNCEYKTMLCESGAACPGAPAPTATKAKDK
jgi:hypothetical protein